MKVLKPFLLGGALGLVLAMAAAVGVYVSPLRKALYLDADPEVGDLRARLADIQDRLTRDELDIASAPEGDRRADSLKAAQAGAWKEYRHRRNRMGELARAHDRVDPDGFAAWAWSLRAWIAPGLGIWILFPGVLASILAARGRRSRPIRAAARPPQNAEEAMASLESALKQMARITHDDRAAQGRSPERAASRGAVALAEPPPERAPSPAPKPASAPDKAFTEKKTEYLEVPVRMPAPPKPAKAAPAPANPASVAPAPFASASPAAFAAPAAPSAPPADPPASVPPAAAPIARPADPFADSPYEVPSGNVFREPETSEFPLPEAGAGLVPGTPAAVARPAGMEIQSLDLGPGWGPPVRSTRDPGTAGPAPKSKGLSMEDEESEVDASGSAEASGEAPSGTFMPPTTEVERVERRKAEVLKLARKGMTSSEISRRMRISQDQVEFIIRMRREKG